MAPYYTKAPAPAYFTKKDIVFVPHSGSRQTRTKGLFWLHSFYAAMYWVGTDQAYSVNV